jgi:hypothetical protein
MARDEQPVVVVLDVGTLACTKAVRLELLEMVGIGRCGEAEDNITGAIGGRRTIEASPVDDEFLGAAHETAKYSGTQFR